MEETAWEVLRPYGLVGLVVLVEAAVIVVLARVVAWQAKEVKRLNDARIAEAEEHAEILERHAEASQRFLERAAAHALPVEPASEREVTP